uniref:RTR1-type domain-containing protein n=1 Tax=Meloidogyne javanica TaxID=6303 RepID=A0A915LH78_MELJA
TKPIKITSTKLLKQIEEQQENIKLAEKRKRTVYEAICALIEPVNEKEMFNYLQVLDLHSWAEVIEERFLGKICGYPICENTLTIDFRRKFVWIKREGRREEILKNNVYVEAQLVKGINELKVTDNIEESSSDEEEEEKEDSEREEERFLEKIRSLSVNTTIQNKNSRFLDGDKEGKESNRNQSKNSPKV